MTRRIPADLLWWALAIMIISVVNTAITMGWSLTIDQDDPGAAAAVAFEQTVWTHMIVGVIIWAVAAHLRWRSTDPAQLTFGEHTRLVVVWLVASIVFDAVVFIGLLGHTPAGTSAQEFYVDSQPWTVIYYLVLIVGALTGARVRRSGARGIGREQAASTAPAVPPRSDTAMW